MVEESLSNQNENNGSNNKKSLAVFVGLIAFCIILVLFYWLFFSNSESTDNAQVAGHIVNVASRIEGQVVKIFVENDAMVKEGDPLILLDNSLHLANVELAQADFNAAMAGFKQATVDVKQARSAFLSAQSAKDLEFKNLQRVKNLKKQRAISQQAVDQQQALYEQTLANFEGAQAVLYMSENTYHAFGDKSATQDKEKFLSYVEHMKGLNPALDAALAKLKRAKANLDLANLNLSYTTIRAPFAGVVANKTAEIGRNVNPNVPLISLVSLTNTWVVANFKETQLSHIKPGQKVDIKIDSYGRAHFGGTVTSIAPASGESFALLPPDNASGNFIKVTQRFPVRIDFQPLPAEIMRPGMSAEVAVSTK